MQNDKLEFSYQSINDIQSTIRALDIKAGFLFVVIFQPITRIDEISNFCIHLASTNILWVFCMLPIFILWSMSVCSLYMAIAAIKNPNDKANGSCSSNTFSCFRMFHDSFLDIFIKRKVSLNELIKNRIEYISSIDSEKICSELAKETIKLSYIRHLKILRVNSCIALTVFWVFYVVFFWLFLSIFGVVNG